MPDADAASLAAGLASLRDLLQGLSLPDAEGLAADNVRAALRAHGDDVAAVTSVAEAVAAAVDRRAALISRRDAAMPTAAELRAAEEGVLAATAAAAVGTGSEEDVRRATEHLAGLLARKRAAEREYADGEAAAAADLDDTSTALPDPGDPWLPAVASALSGVLSSVGSTLTPDLFSGAPVSQASEASAAASPADPARGAAEEQLLDKLVPANNGDASQFPAPQGMDPFDHTAFPGRTHTSADVALTPSALTGVQTVSDTSPRPANPFLGQTPATTTGTPTPGGAPMMGAPMMPPGGGMGMGPGDNPGVAQGKKRRSAHIIDNRDPKFTGDHIDARIATSGVIGRGEDPRWTDGRGEQKR